MLAKGFKFLETADDDRLGGKCLIGLAFVKQGKREEHDKVKSAVEACLNVTAGEPEAIDLDIYSNGLAIIFLCNLDPYKYRIPIEKLIIAMERKQKKCGGWGYPNEEVGDSSMTQYGALSLWEASKVGFPIPDRVLENCAIWLIRVQDPSGGWPYKGKHEGTNPETGVYKRIEQGTEVRLGVTTAALGSTYICADLLRITIVIPRNDDPTLSPALIQVLEAAPPAKPNERVDAAALKKAQDDGRLYFRANYSIKSPVFPHYYLYALERFQSFAEASDGRIIKESGWYNEGVTQLKKTQLEDGSWEPGGLPKPIDTAFACLFLLRSTKKSIERAKEFAAAKLVGGNRLPKDFAQAKVRDQKVVAPLGQLETDKLLAAILDPQRPEFPRVLDNVPEVAVRLRGETLPDNTPVAKRLVTAFPEAPVASRVLILRIFSQMDQLRHVPTLIIGLEDVNLQVRREALESLQKLTKRISPLGSEALSDAKKHAELIADWKAWYSRLSNPRIDRVAESAAGSGS